MKTFLFQIFFILLLGLGIFLFYSYNAKTILSKDGEKFSKNFSNSLNQKNFLVFSGFFGCSTICPKSFEIAKQIGKSFSKQELEIIFLNTDPLIQEEDFRKFCKEIFASRVECVFPQQDNFQNFFRNLELPIYTTKEGFEHSANFLLYRAHDKILFSLQNPNINEIKKILSL